MLDECDDRNPKFVEYDLYYLRLSLYLRQRNGKMNLSRNSAFTMIRKV